MEHESLVIILSLGGSPLDRLALDGLRDIAIGWVRVEQEGEAACLAARVRHGDPPDDFRDRLRRWGSGRGWTITVAPSRRLG